MSPSSERFDALAAEWERHCEEHREASNPFVFVQHPSFESLVGLGRAAVPLIIERYRHGSVFWGAALRRITGVTTFGEGVVGDLEANRRGWLKWWDAHQAEFPG
ncbi:hypothetical protein OWM54_13945 [Myxococcus sp. MISCRS1]|jgi:hypothetical protein|uniref:Uncharacterized protein n=1 Tax=Myxococcus fulvus TaxID=33 RepID=A0A511STJ6_MYXFU|nr:MULTISPECIES: hypothetical protein [Myxococcus]AKF84939.1 hypothetical protein MFUL124B02_06935 [Myxococcus fulvus 124B02]BDT31698.1 hypothetical protein MFMH1_13670 [Myxococcus sp. MH1]MBZ4397585.1 hypothetical protein [Myxococcus sp. AS-1-15]MBZ4407848.1 hypothetical protein [Myxococcus sp. XM-1-1-1]MCY0998232.1 hypothetical protein [Myxococcus sp. MISCRS1]